MFWVGDTGLREVEDFSILNNSATIFAGPVFEGTRILQVCPTAFVIVTPSNEVTHHLPILGSDRAHISSCHFLEPYLLLHLSDDTVRIWEFDVDTNEISALQLPTSDVDRTICACIYEDREGIITTVAEAAAIEKRRGAQAAAAGTTRETAAAQMDDGFDFFGTDTPAPEEESDLSEFMEDDGEDVERSATKTGRYYYVAHLHDGSLQVR